MAPFFIDASARRDQARQRLFFNLPLALMAHRGPAFRATAGINLILPAFLDIPAGESRAEVNLDRFRATHRYLPAFSKFRKTFSPQPRVIPVGSPDMGTRESGIPFFKQNGGRARGVSRRRLFRWRRFSVAKKRFLAFLSFNLWWSPCCGRRLLIHGRVLYQKVLVDRRILAN